MSNLNKTELAYNFFTKFSNLKFDENLLAVLKLFHVHKQTMQTYYVLCRVVNMTKK
jgi:hypothetical protein